MSDKKKDIQNDLLRGRSLKRKLNVTDEGAKKIIRKVTTVENKPKKTIRTTIDLPEYIHAMIKTKAAEKQMTLKRYIIGLVEKDSRNML